MRKLGLDSRFYSRWLRGREGENYRAWCINSGSITLNHVLLKPDRCCGLPLFHAISVALLIFSNSHAFSQVSIHCFCHSFRPLRTIISRSHAESCLSLVLLRGVTPTEQSIVLNGGSFLSLPHPSTTGSTPLRQLHGQPHPYVCGAAPDAAVNIYLGLVMVLLSFI
jgi:hypothetical protein